MHAWRHTFKARADRAGITERTSDYITGHAQRTVGGGAGEVSEIRDSEVIPAYRQDTQEESLSDAAKPPGMETDGFAFSPYDVGLGATLSGAVEPRRGAIRPQKHSPRAD
jgi:hypothetical protein